MSRLDPTTRASRRPAVPKSAFLAVTLLCNSRCVMCDIWKNKGMDFLSPEIFRKLPSSLEMIDITGGEPFLRPDIPELVSSLRQTCPKARILITTHGFMTDKIEGQLQALLNGDPEIAFRLSLDGLGKVHEEIRQIPQAFEKVLATLTLLQKSGVKDLGIIFTLMKQNRHQLREVYQFCKERGVSFTLNAVHDSSVYFGEGKQGMNADPQSVKSDFDFIFWEQMKTFRPKNWAKAWFNQNLLRYLQTHRRAIACGAGDDFFYMDSHANIFMCQYKNWPIGNLVQSSFEDIWNSPAQMKFSPQARQCHDCWAICTVKDSIKRNKAAVLASMPALIQHAL